MGLRVRTGRPVWFGTPVTWPFTVAVAELEAGAGDGGGDGGDGGDGGEGKDGKDARDARERPEQDPVRAPLDVEFVQIPIFPTWLLAVLAALLALLLAWFLLVRPAVRSTAKEAADEAVKKPAPSADLNGQTPVTGDGKQPGGGKGTQPGAGGAARAAVPAVVAEVAEVAVPGPEERRARPPSTCRRAVGRPRPVPTRCPRARPSGSRTSLSRTSRATKEW